MPENKEECLEFTEGGSRLAGRHIEPCETRSWEKMGHLTVWSSVNNINTDKEDGIILILSNMTIFYVIKAFCAL